jgi:hypothetical protein
MYPEPVLRQSMYGSTPRLPGTPVHLRTLAHARDELIDFDRISADNMYNIMQIGLKVS